MTDTTKALKPVLTFLQRHPPFKQMSATHQEYLAMHLEQVFFAEKESIIQPIDGVVECLYIVKNGCVSRKLKAGSCFPVAALLDKRAVNKPYQAIKSTICYQLTQPHFEYLMQQSQVFHEFIAE
jgi:CBS domain-containing protein